MWNTATIKQDKAWEEAERCSHEKSDLYMLQFLEYNLIFIYILEVEKQIFMIVKEKMYGKNRNFEKKQKETLMLRKISNEKFNNKLDTAELKISEQDYR